MIPKHALLFVRYRGATGRRPLPPLPAAKLRFCKRQNLPSLFRISFIFLLLTGGGKPGVDPLLVAEVLANVGAAPVTLPPSC